MRQFGEDKEIVPDVWEEGLGARVEDSRMIEGGRGAGGLPWCV